MGEKVPSKEELRELYCKEFPLRAQINYELLKDRLYELVDWKSLLEEIEGMVRQELNEALKRLVNIFVHLYKWDYLRTYTGAGYERGGIEWIKSIENERRHIRALIRAFPSVRKRLSGELQRGSYLATPNIIEEAQELGVELREEDLPQECPYTYEEAMNRDLRKEVNP